MPMLAPNIKLCAFSVLFAGMALLFPMYLQAAQLLSFEGRAKDIKTSELLYTEKHEIILNEAGEYLSAYVSYRDIHGEIFAEKVLDYSKSALAPDLMFYDKRTDEHLSVFFNNRDNFLHVVAERAKKRNGTNVKLDSSIVAVDAGFDRLIHDNWDTLRKNKIIDFTFLAITRAQLFKFEAVEKTVKESKVQIELHPRNFFIDMLVDPIVLEYDLESRRLLSFEGLTNIERFKNGKRSEENYVARIDYYYQALKPYSLLSLTAIEITRQSTQFIKSVIKP